MFKLSKSAAIYHDDPYMVKNEADCRVSVGFFVNESKITNSNSQLSIFYLFTFYC